MGKVFFVVCWMGKLIFCDVVNSVMVEFNFVVRGMDKCWENEENNCFEGDG